MSRLFRFFIIIFALTALAGCAPPIGNITAGTAVQDSLWTVPYRVNYDLNDLFQPQSDVLVFASSRGVVMSISVADVGISMIEDPDFRPNDVTPIPTDEKYLFTKTGRKIVVVTYNDLSTQYSIQVLDPISNGNGNGSNGNNSGGGLGFRWWDDP